MTLTGAQFTLGTATVVQIVANHHNPQRVTVHNQENQSSRFAYLGGADVSSANGVHLDNGQTMEFTLNPGEALFAIASHQDVEVGVIRQVV